jgi:O-antigen/teichoic acid export membrane protein
VAVGAAVALITAVVQVFLIELPVAARRVAAGHHVAVRDRADQLALGAVAAGGAVALAGVVIGPPLVDVVLGSDFDGAAAALGPALAAVPLAPVAALGANHALLAGRATTRVLLAAAGAAAFALAAMLLLSQGSDASEVALATLAGAAAAAAAAAVYSRPPARVVVAAAAASALVWAVGSLVA